MGIVLAIDECRRQEVLGAMPICGMLVPEEDYNYLYHELGVRDSKTIEPKIKEIGKILKEKYEYTTFLVSAEEISKSDNLNKLETEYILRLVQKYYQRVDKIIIDSICSDPEKLFDYCGKLNDYRDKLVIECKADSNYVAVMAASVIAKYDGNCETLYLRNKYGVGSGAPSDPRTLNYLINNLNNPHKIIRTRWKTYTRLSDVQLRNKLKKMINSGKFNTQELSKLYKNGK